MNNAVIETLTPARLQEENAVWVAHNFGIGKPYQPLLGMLEECGELVDAINEWNVAEIRDALGDAVVFCADICTKRGWDFGKLWPFQSGIIVGPSKDLEKNLLRAFRALAKAAHHQLKSEQGIRGDLTKHEQEGARAIQDALFNLETIAKHFGWTLMEVTGPVWAKVKQRDFKKDAATGGEVRP
jgi:hypothetical protein